MNKEKIFKISFISLIITFFTIVLILPLITLFIKGFQNRDGVYIGFQNFIEYFNNPISASSLEHSLLVSILTTIIVMTLALFYSYGITRTSIKGKMILRSVALIPLFAPTMTHGIALIYLFGKQGLVTRYLGIELPIYGLLGIVMAEVIYIFPILFLMLSLSLSSTDYRLYEVAELMGISKLKKFLTITIPSIKYTLITGFFASFTLSFTDFGAPKVIGGNYNVLATDIFKQVIGQQNISMGSAIGILLIIPALIAFIIDLIVQKKNNALDNRAVSYVIKRNGSRDLAYTIYNYTIMTIIVVFFSVILLASLVKTWPYNMSLSLGSYNFTLMGESIWIIFANSIFVSILTALFGTTICFITAYFLEREKQFVIMRKIGYFLSILPNAIPGLTIGLAYIFFFNSTSNPLNFLYGTFGILIFANIIHFFANPFLTITAALKKLDTEYESIGEIMGVSKLKVIAKVILPLSLSSILESFSYYFINSMITISAVVFLYTTGTRLISIGMINKSDSGDIAAAAAIAILIIMTNIIFKLIFSLAIKIVKNRMKSHRRKERKQRDKQSHSLVNNGREAFHLLSKVSRETNIKYWLEFGTLLGKIRENNFLTNDINLNIGMYKKDITPEFLINMEEVGFKRENSLTIKTLGLRELIYDYKGVKIEIYIYEKVGNDCIEAYSLGENNKIISYRFKTVELEESKFMGERVWIPKHPEKHLKEIYGDKYNLPDPNWKDEMGKNRKEVEDLKVLNIRFE